MILISFYRVGKVKEDKERMKLMTFTLCFDKILGGKRNEKKEKEGKRFVMKITLFE